MKNDTGTVRITEQIVAEAMDAEGRLSGVVLCGVESRGMDGKVRRVYAEMALKDIASLAPGRHLYVDHGERLGKVRSVRDLLGVVEGAEYRDGKVYATLRVMESRRGMIRDIIDIGPHGVGFSGVYAAQRRTRNGMEEVMRVEDVASFDLVSIAATTTTLYESEEDIDHVEVEEMDWSKVSVEVLREQCPGVIDELLAESQQEVSKLREQVESLQAEKQRAELRESIDAVLQESVMASWPEAVMESAMSEGFRAALHECDTVDQAKDLIAQREKDFAGLVGIVESAEKHQKKPTVPSVPRTYERGTDLRVKEV